MIDKMAVMLRSVEALKVVHATHFILNEIRIFMIIVTCRMSSAMRI